MTNHGAQLNELQGLLQELNTKDFERLAAALIGNLLNVPIAVAKSGFQHGGDAGPAGRGKRTFRIECKRYSDSTPLSDRELEGEIDDALRRDPALEAWVLVSTREVSEQTEQTLLNKSEKVGVPVIIFDWKKDSPPILAALCTSSPKIVSQYLPNPASNLAAELASDFSSSLRTLKRDLETWFIGFEALRQKAYDQLATIWTSSSAARAVLGQNAAGGASGIVCIDRPAISDQLDKWWKNESDDAPSVILGTDGVGKTWAALQWLIQHAGDLPIVLVIPASSAAVATLSTVSGIKQWLAERLQELTQVQTPEHWRHRVERLLSRPAEEGPALLLFVDGINQAPGLPWLQFLRFLQADPFAARIRLVTCTRKLHFDERLGKLRGLDRLPELLTLTEFDNSPGGEFDQMLASEGLTQSELPLDLIPLARNPRLFRLVIRLRSKMNESGDVTVHRLLWEYGRDSLGDRSGESFSEESWQEWLRSVVAKLREGSDSFTRQQLSETVNAAHLTANDVFKRLSDIIDGHFHTTADGPNRRLTPVLVYHALAIALLDQLRGLQHDACEERLEAWLDPIAGLDQRAEILRASVSILVEIASPTDQPLLALLVRAWLVTQNLPVDHSEEVIRLALPLCLPLLDAIETTNPYSQRTTRDVCIAALRSLPKDNRTAWHAIRDRVAGWLSVISKDVDRDNKDGWIAKELRSKLSSDALGTRELFGVNLSIVDNFDASLQKVGATLIDGFPLSDFGQLPLAAAIHTALRRDSTVYDAIQWLQVFNNTDREEFEQAIRSTAEAVLTSALKSGISANLPKRVASLLYWLSGTDRDEAEARRVGPKPFYDYTKDYLQDPSHSSFELERRHAGLALADSTIALRNRLMRTADMWLDPEFEGPQEFADELTKALAAFDVTQLDNHVSFSLEDHFFKDVEPVVARVDPNQLATLVRRKLQSFSQKTPETRHWAAIRSERHLMLVDENAKKAARSLRETWHGTYANNDDIWAQSDLLSLELIDDPVVEQSRQVVLSNLPLLPTSLNDTLRSLEPDSAKALVNDYLEADPKRQKLLALLLNWCQGPLPEEVWNWLIEKAFDETFEGKTSVWRVLATVVSERFGKLLDESGWSWDPLIDPYINHYGTIALVEATRSRPLEDILSRLAPWRLPGSARARGNAPEEVRMVASAMDALLDVKNSPAPEPDSRVSVNLESREKEPFSVMISVQSGSNDDPFAGLKGSLDWQAQSEVFRRAVKAAVDRINEARRQGAKLYLMSFSADDFAPIIEHAPSTLKTWLEGVDDGSTTFRTRVNLAIGAYHAICEALLRGEPERGVLLWRALRQVSHTRITGTSGIDDLLLMLFRVPPSASIENLLNEVFQPTTTNTDKELLDLCIAAETNGRTQWLRNFIEQDRASSIGWRRQRADVLEGFLTDQSLPLQDAWPEGPAPSDSAIHTRRAAKWRYRAACMRHWWNAYVEAETEEAAYAAWILFVASADRRDRVIRMQRPVKDDGSHLAHRKTVHLIRNLDALDSAAKERERNADGEFLFSKISAGISPWRG